MGTVKNRAQVLILGCLHACSLQEWREHYIVGFYHLYTKWVWRGGIARIKAVLEAMVAVTLEDCMTCNSAF